MFLMIAYYEHLMVNDDWSPEEVASMLMKEGCEAVWKDWEPVLDAF